MKTALIYILCTAFWVLVMMVLLNLFPESETEFYEKPGRKFSGETVYIGEGGEKFHKENCYHLKNATGSMVREEAEYSGFTACKSCIK